MHFPFESDFVVRAERDARLGVLAIFLLFPPFSTPRLVLFYRRPLAGPSSYYLPFCPDRLLNLPLIPLAFSFLSLLFPPFVSSVPSLRASSPSSSFSSSSRPLLCCRPLFVPARVALSPALFEGSAPTGFELSRISRGAASARNRAESFLRPLAFFPAEHS